MKQLVILMAALLLSACGQPPGSTPIADLPPSLVTECAPNLPKWPDGPLTQSQVERAALNDGKVYRDCASKHNALVGVLRGAQ